MSELQRTLRTLHEELGQARQLDPEDRALLETVLAPMSVSVRRSWRWSSSDRPSQM